VHQLCRTRHPQIRSEDTELPSSEGFSVARGATIGDVEFQAGIVEADGLAYGANVGVFKREQDAKAAQADGVRLVFEGTHFECCKLEMKMVLVGVQGMKV